MSTLVFPPVEEADEDGFLGLGGPVSVENLINAYTRGIFPWPWSPEHVAWFAPPQRAILEFSSFHIPQSLKKLLRKKVFEIRIDTVFREVVLSCAHSKNRKHQKGTWITDEIIEGYTALHHAGAAHSFEVFHDSKLVGGLYGVNLGTYFSAESMFYTEDNASKVALTAAVGFLSSHNLSWIDCQVMNDNTAHLGAIEISREEFTTRVEAALQEPSPQWP